MAIMRYSDSAIKNRSHFKIKFFITNLCTLFNAVLGLCAIFAAFNKQPLMSALLIFIAACCDGCDGRLARAFGVSSTFGSELDSLADAISFCLAPVVLIMTYFPPEYTTFCMAVGAFYLCAGLWRLARFNSSCHNQICYFIGLPTTISAMTLSSSLLIKHLNPFISMEITALIIGSQTILLSLLMVSFIPFAKYPQNRFSVTMLICATLGMLLVYLPLSYSVSLFWGVIQFYIFFYFFTYLLRKKNGKY